MGLVVKDIIGIVDTIASFDLAEEWDNSGLQAGDLSWPVKKVMVSLDVTMDVLEAAKIWGADLVLSHHPLILGPQKIIEFGKMPGSAIALSACEKISILSAHTNLDKSWGGLNDQFARIVGLAGINPFCPEPNFQGGKKFAGLGRTGHLKMETSLKELAENIKDKMEIDGIRVIGSLDHKVSRVVVCTGSGGSLTRLFLDSGADVFITGDLKYHDARMIEAEGKAAVDVGHFASEHIAVDLLTV